MGGYYAPPTVTNQHDCSGYQAYGLRSPVGGMDSRSRFPQLAASDLDTQLQTFLSNNEYNRLNNSYRSFRSTCGVSAVLYVQPLIEILTHTPDATHDVICRTLEEKVNRGKTHFEQLARIVMQARYKSSNNISRENLVYDWLSDNDFAPLLQCKDFGFNNEHELQKNFFIQGYNFFPSQTLSDHKDLKNALLELRKGTRKFVGAIIYDGSVHWGTVFIRKVSGQNEKIEFLLFDDENWGVTSGFQAPLEKLAQFYNEAPFGQELVGKIALKLSSAKKANFLKQLTTFAYKIPTQYGLYGSQPEQIISIDSVRPQNARDNNWLEPAIIAFQKESNNEAVNNTIWQASETEKKKQFEAFVTKLLDAKECPTCHTVFCYNDPLHAPIPIPCGVVNGAALTSWDHNLLCFTCIKEKLFCFDNFKRQLKGYKKMEIKSLQCPNTTCTRSITHAFAELAFTQADPFVFGRACALLYGNQALLDYEQAFSVDHQYFDHNLATGISKAQKDIVIGLETCGLSELLQASFLNPASLTALQQISASLSSFNQEELKRYTAESFLVEESVEPNAILNWCLRLLELNVPKEEVVSALWAMYTEFNVPRENILSTPMFKEKERYNFEDIFKVAKIDACLDAVKNLAGQSSVTPKIKLLKCITTIQNPEDYNAFYSDDNLPNPYDQNGDDSYFYFKTMPDAIKLLLNDIKELAMNVKEGRNHDVLLNRIIKKAQALNETIKTWPQPGGDFNNQQVNFFERLHLVEYQTEYSIRAALEEAIASYNRLNNLEATLKADLTFIGAEVQKDIVKLSLDGILTKYTSSIIDDKGKKEFLEKAFARLSADDVTALINKIRLQKDKNERALIEDWNTVNRTAFSNIHEIASDLYSLSEAKYAADLMSFTQPDIVGKAPTLVGVYNEYRHLEALLNYFEHRRKIAKNIEPKALPELVELYDYAEYIKPNIHLASTVNIGLWAIGRKKALLTGQSVRQNDITEELADLNNQIETIKNEIDKLNDGNAIVEKIIAEALYKLEMKRDKLARLKGRLDFLDNIGTYFSDKPKDGLGALEAKFKDLGKSLETFKTALMHL